MAHSISFSCASEYGLTTGFSSRTPIAPRKLVNKSVLPHSGSGLRLELWNNLELFPVVRKFLAAFKTNYISPGLPRCGRPSLPWFDREGKAKSPVPATKQEIGNSNVRKHWYFA